MAPIVSFLVIFLFTIVAHDNYAFAQPRGGVALVVGMPETPGSSRRDERAIEAITRSFELTGFETRSVTDGDPYALRSAFEEFWARTSYNQHAAIFYSGFARRELDDIALSTDRFGRRDDTSLRKIIERLERQRQTAFIFLDLCLMDGRPFDIRDLSPWPGLFLSMNLKSSEECHLGGRPSNYAMTLADLILRRNTRISRFAQELEDRVGARGHGAPSLQHINALRSEFYFAPTQLMERELALLAEHTGHAIGMERKRRTGYFSQPDREVVLETVHRRNYSFLGIQTRLTDLDPEGGTAALIYGNCSDPRAAGALCVTLIDSQAAQEFPLKIRSSSSLYVARLARDDLQVAAGSVDRKARASRYLRKFTPGGAPTADVERAADDIKSAAGCAKVTFDCISEAILPKSLHGKIMRYRAVVILPVGSIGALPFAALRFGDGHLVDKVSMVVVPDLDSLVRGRALGFGELPVTRIVIADPDLTGPPHQIKGSLPGARAEGEVVATAVGAELIAGSQASLDSIRARLERDAARIGLIYFATHGMANSSDPLDKSVLLLNGGDLSGSVIKALPLKGRPLIVMSACQTGLGRTFPSGVFGLAQAWLEAGASGVVMSLWDVDDEATSILMREFVTLWRAGSPTEQALRQAVVKLKSDDRFKQPNLWSGFAYYGPPSAQIIAKGVGAGKP